MDAFLRQATPLMVVGLGAVGAVWPEHLRWVVLILAIYLALLVLERQRLDQRLTQLLGAFQEFARASAGGAPAGAAAAPDAATRREAVTILVEALGSAEAEVRASSAEHLRRLTGQDLGDDRAAWEAWIAGGGLEAAPQGRGDGGSGAGGTGS